MCLIELKFIGYDRSPILSLSLNSIKKQKKRKKTEAPRTERRAVSEEVWFACVLGHVDGGGQNE